MYSEAQVKALKSRWSRDLVNHLVIAMNSGEPIEKVLESVASDPQIPVEPHRLDLRGIDFSHQNLRGPWIDVKGHHVRAGVILRDADLSWADLSWALLPRADLSGALLHQADMRYAELILSNLDGADLTGAQMDGAWLLDTRFHSAVVSLEQLAARRNLGQMDLDIHAFEL